MFCILFKSVFCVNPSSFWGRKIGTLSWPEEANRPDHMKAVCGKEGEWHISRIQCVLSHCQQFIASLAMVWLNTGFLDVWNLDVCHTGIYAVASSFFFYTHFQSQINDSVYINLFSSRNRNLIFCIRLSSNLKS